MGLPVLHASAASAGIHASARRRNSTGTRIDNAASDARIVRIKRRSDRIAQYRSLAGVPPPPLGGAPLYGGSVNRADSDLHGAGFRAVVARRSLRPASGLQRVQ